MAERNFGGNDDDWDWDWDWDSDWHWDFNSRVWRNLNLCSRQDWRALK